MFQITEEVPVISVLVLASESEGVNIKSQVSKVDMSLVLVEKEEPRRDSPTVGTSYKKIKG